MRGMWPCVSMLLAALNGAAFAQQERGMGGVGILVFADPGFRGQNATFRQDVPDLSGYGLNDRISSLRVTPGETWEVCQDRNYRGRCQVFYGDESDLRSRGWNDAISSMRRIDRSGGPPATTPPVYPPTGGGIEFFDQRNFRGDRRVITDAVPDLRALGFDNRAQSLRLQGAQNWEVCTDAYFRGCLVVKTDWPDLNRLGKYRQISSARPWSQGGGGGYPPTWGGGIELFDQPSFRGDRRVITDAVPDLRALGFDNRAQSLRLQGAQNWEVCTDAYFRGCLVVKTDWPDLNRLGKHRQISSVRPGGQGGSGYPPSGEGSGRLVLFDSTSFRGRSFTVTESLTVIPDIFGAESAQVTGTWQVCDLPQFEGECAVITSDVPDLRAIGLRGRVLSARPYLTPR